MDITANDFFRQQYFAVTWNKDQMDKTTMSPNDCIKMMELYYQHKLKLLGIADVVGQSEQLKAVEKLKDFAYEVCPLHREDDLQEILGSL